ncbi:MAG: polysaccharide biosynthesis/export family protein [Acidobacteriota bacterium]
MTTTRRRAATDAIANHARFGRRTACVGLTLVLAAVTVDGQAPGPRPALPAVAATAAATTIVPADAPSDYIIGSDDVLSVLFWNDKDLSAPLVTVRPDGKVTLPLLNDVQAAGRTPEQLRDAIKVAAQKYVEDPNPTVIVKEIKSRRVFITGQVEKPGTYALNGPTTILQLIAIAGGLKDFADSKKISLLRNDGGRPVVHAFNYQDVLKVKNLRQNIELRPDDTVVVP